MSVTRRTSHGRLIFAVALTTIASLDAARRPSAAAEIPAIAARQRAEKKTFTDSEITEGFFKTAFGAEYHLAGRVDRIRKYDGPVRVFADGTRRAMSATTRASWVFRLLRPAPSANTRTGLSYFLMRSTRPAR